MNNLLLKVAVITATVETYIVYLIVKHVLGMLLPVYAIIFTWTSFVLLIYITAEFCKINRTGDD